MKSNSEKITAYSIDDVEVLVSTMKRTSLDFLEAMFANNDINKHHILIINQTDARHQLNSKSPNIRVINTEGKGLSKSRNLAIKNAIKPICIVADDDVVYLKDFVKIVAEGHCKYPSAGLISFQVKNFSGKPYKNYNNIEKEIKKRRKETPLSSVEITFKKNYFLKNKIFFDERFGLGSIFQAGEEEILLLQLFQKNIKVYQVPKYILSHPDNSSASDQGSDRFIYARGGLKYIQYGNWSKLWLLKFIFFLIRHHYISFWDFINKYNVGYSAIKKMKDLIREGEKTSI